MTSFFKIQYERFFHLCHRLRNVWPIWFYVYNAEPRRLWKKLAVRPDAVQTRMVSALARDGIAAIPMQELMGDLSFFEAMCAYVAERVRDPLVIRETARRKELLENRTTEGKRAGKYLKDFWVPLFPADQNNKIPYDAANPFFQFVMHPRILQIAALYFDFIPKLNSFTLQSTLLVPPGTPEYLSQRWHRDSEDKKMLKVFVYLTDVNERGAGPFMYVRGSQHGGRWRHLFPQRPPAGSYPPSGAVERAVPEKDIALCLAPRGTVIFCDTSGLHRGGYSTTMERTMFLPAFCSRASVSPINFERPPASALAGYGDLARFTLAP
ncbi:MAG: hypothetical protein WAP52_00645 [Candidatus Sungiibacteriota bacterium]